MREVSGTTWSFQIIILFILIFAAFLTLVLNYFKAYNVKNEMLTIIEKYEGITIDSMGIINNVLRDKGYKTVGSCPTEDGIWYGTNDLNGSYEKSKKGTKYYFCFQKIVRNDNSNKDWDAGVYYNVKVFYRFNLPIIGEVATFTINGRTGTFIGADADLGD